MLIAIAGWISKNDFQRLAHDINLGHGPRVGLRLSELPEHAWFAKRVAYADAFEHAMLRQDKDRAWVPDRQVDKTRSSIALDVEGAAGEIAVAEWLDVPLSKKAIRYGGDPGYDMVDRDGRTVDVKTTRRDRNPHLFFKRVEKFKADIAVLTLVFYEPGELALQDAALAQRGLDQRASAGDRQAYA